MLKEFIGEIKGRHLTNLLLNLEKSFQLVCKQLKNDRSLDDFRKLSFLALSNIVVEILREMRVEVYSVGKDFDPIEFLNSYEEQVVNDDNKEKQRKAFTKLKKIKPVKKEDSDSEYIVEEDSDDESDSDYEPKYLDKNNQEIDEMEESEEEEQEEEEEESYFIESLSKNMELIKLNISNVTGNEENFIGNLNIQITS